MISFPVNDLMDDTKCYQFLLAILHPKGLRCRCGQLLPNGQKPHKLLKNKLPSFKCRSCHSVFNLFTGTIFSGIHDDCIIIVLMLQGFIQGKTTKLLSEELDVNDANLLDWRHQLQEFSFENKDHSVVLDQEVESDEVFMNAGEKGDPHTKEEDPPRVRAHKKKEWAPMIMIVLQFKVSLGERQNKYDCMDV